MAETMLKVDNINVYYGNIHAVKDVSFEGICKDEKDSDFLKFRTWTDCGRTGFV